MGGIDDTSEVSLEQTAVSVSKLFVGWDIFFYCVHIDDERTSVRLRSLYVRLFRAGHRLFWRSFFHSSQILFRVCWTNVAGFCPMVVGRRFLDWRSRLFFRRRCCIGTRRVRHDCDRFGWRYGIEVPIGEKVCAYQSRPSDHDSGRGSCKPEFPCSPLPFRLSETSPCRRFVGVFRLFCFVFYKFVKIHHNYSLFSFNTASLSLALALFTCHAEVFSDIPICWEISRCE